MKRFISLMIAALLICSMASAFAAVPSKTTTNATVVTTVTTSTGVEIAETFAVSVQEDSEPVAKEIEKIFTFVSEGNAPIEYFPVEVKEEIIAKLPETIVDAEIEINEFVTVDIADYAEEYGDVEISFSFTTVYAPEQTIVALVGIYNGEVDENGEPIVEWIVLDAIVNEDGSVAITFTQDAMVKMQAAESTSLAIINTPAVEEVPAE